MAAAALFVGADRRREQADLRVPPGNRLEMLKGKLARYHSIRINDQWRVVLRWQSGNASDVQIVDYH